MESPTFTLFAGSQAIASGSRAEVAAALGTLQAVAEHRTALVFDDATGEQVDLDVRSSSASADGSIAEPERRGPGRPKLGVVAREVTLLPRHWEWLNAQPGGASVALRKLVESARRDSAESDRARRSQEAAFRFMSALAGNEPRFEEACRALFGSDREAFESRTDAWPRDVAVYARKLATGAFEPEA